ncbi:nudix hydrolase 9 [Homo sapiens]|uniref:Nudix hydrolase 9 n=1 Tax=Homo sapiens TaxID=9606 RepID=D6R8Z6_HUMAN|nr:nudix hydrolase 9 [Homo sapiens]KAI4026203.1 nudix hydrolase 9 [Homo sapiens]
MAGRLLGKALAAVSLSLALASVTIRSSRCRGIQAFRNPAGRTGLVGRGLLGRWGPNHAADPIITRGWWIQERRLVPH